MKNYKQSYAAYAVIKEIKERQAALEAKELAKKDASKLDIFLSMISGAAGGSFLALVWVYANGWSLFV